MTHIKIIEQATDIMSHISSEIYRLQELTVDSNMEDTFPENIISQIQDLYDQVELIDQDLQSLYYKETYNNNSYKEKNVKYSEVIEYL